MGLIKQLSLEEPSLRKKLREERRNFGEKTKMNKKGKMETDNIKINKSKLQLLKINLLISKSL